MSAATSKPPANAEQPCSASFRHVSATPSPAILTGPPIRGVATLKFIKLAQATLELIQPGGGGEGVQHLAFQVTDLDRTIKGFDDGGMPVLHQGRYDDDSGAYVYVGSATALGVTLELLHSEPKK